MEECLLLTTAVDLNKDSKGHLIISIQAFMSPN